MKRWTGLFTYACFTRLFVCICRSFVIKQFFYPVSWAQTLWSSFTESTGSPTVVMPSNSGKSDPKITAVCYWCTYTQDMDRLRCAFQLKTEIWKSDWPTSDVAARHFVKSPSGVQGFPFPNAFFGFFQMWMRNESHGQVKKTSDVNYSCATRNPRLLPFCNEQRNSCKLIYSRLEAFVKVQSSIIPRSPSFCQDSYDSECICGHGGA